jgi:hypothetical protein
MGIGKKTTVIEVDYKELEDLIKDTYRHEFDIVADQEWNNDESHSVEFQKGVSDNYTRRTVDTFKKDGSGNFVLYALMQDMVNEGILEEGQYLIGICW